MASPLCSSHHGSVEEIIRHKMVKGLVLDDSTTPPDPICEPCLAGKLHRGPIPKVAQHRSSSLLGLIHSDLHGPLPVEARRNGAIGSHSLMTSVVIGL